MCSPCFVEPAPQRYNGRPAPVPRFMRIYMQDKPAAGETPHYVQLSLAQDLLGGWTLYRESGQQGGRITLRREQHLDRDEAITAFENARDRQLKRGFKIMITEGMESPHGY